MGYSHGPGHAGQRRRNESDPGSEEGGVGRGSVSRLARDLHSSHGLAHRGSATRSDQRGSASRTCDRSRRQPRPCTGRPANRPPSESSRHSHRPEPTQRLLLCQPPGSTSTKRVLDAPSGRESTTAPRCCFGQEEKLLRTIRGAREFCLFVKAALSEARLPRLSEHCLGESRVALRVCRSARHVRRQNSPASPSWSRMAWFARACNGLTLGGNDFQP
jgi:hypothetical protein